jgi:hypothetical protein
MAKKIKKTKKKRSQEGEGAKMDDESGNMRSQERKVYAWTLIEKGN